MYNNWASGEGVEWACSGGWGRWERWGGGGEGGGRGAGGMGGGGGRWWREREREITADTTSRVLRVLFFPTQSGAQTPIGSWLKSTV